MVKRILIVDDSVTIQKAFAMTFAGEDVTLSAARSADEGLTMAQRARPDLVIADVVMPGRTGYDLCASIKGDPSLRGVPVYLLTSLHNPFDEAHGRRVGADGNFVKPFDTTALISGVFDAIAKGALAPAPAPPPGRRTGPVVPLGDDYGEISMSGSSSGVRPNAVVPSRVDSEITPPPPPRAPMAPPAAPAFGAGATMRPSLIPGMRPGAPMARPGAAPGLATAAAAAPAPAYPRGPGMPGGTPAAPPAPAMAARAPGANAPLAGARTMMGIPAASLNVPLRAPAPAPAALTPAAPVVPAAQPLRPVAAPASAPSAIAAQAAAAVSSRVAEKMAALSARGPEYEAVARVAREIIEKIAWEIIPELAEAIVRDELHKRGRI